MAVSKRLRFEIFRRDNHACRYCGASAPDAKLTVDHVVAVALGGSDQPENLVTACGDCNSGKTSMPADAPLIADVAADALRWSKAMEQAADAMTASRDKKMRNRQRFLDEIWNQYTYYGGRTYAIPDGWGESIDQFIAAGLDFWMAEEAVEIAMTTRNVHDRWRYFCGVAWKYISRKQEVARQILATGEDN